MKFRILPLFFLFSLLVHSVFAQKQDSTLSYEIEDVTVKTIRNLFFKEDLKVVSFDSVLLKYQCLGNLADLLSSSSGVYVKSNGGSGGLSTLSLRGTASNQTAICWNGFPVNYLTTGDLDISSIPISFVSDVSVVYGASASLNGSGTFGGLINIGNSADWQKQSPFLSAQVQQAFGSFGNRRFNTLVKAGNSYLQTSILFFHNFGENNFPYKDGNEIITQKHNQAKETGFIQNIFVKLPGTGQLDFGLWLQRKSKQIAPIIGSFTDANALQNDSTLRLFLKYRKLLNNTSIQVGSAFFADYLHYTEATGGTFIDSKIKGNRLLNELTFRNFALQNIVLEAGILHSHQQADVKYYNQVKTEENFGVYSAVKFEQSFLLANFSVRKDFYTSGNSPFLVSGGFLLKFIPNVLNLRGNISNKFRKPTFNELFWTPGGNPDILPEKGFGGDLGLSFSKKINKLQVIHFETSAYSFNITDYILWVSDGGLASPKNFKEVWSRGLEQQIKYELTLPKIRLYASADYSFTKCTNSKMVTDQSTSLGKQLMYVPLHSLKFFTQINYAGLFGGYNFTFCGIRQTTDDNSSYYILPEYKLSNAFLGWKWQKTHYSSEIQFRVNNLFDISYQIIRAYPMEGRSFVISYSLGFNI